MIISNLTSYGNIYGCTTTSQFLVLRKARTGAILINLGDLFRNLQINHLRIPIKYRGLKPSQTQPLEQAIAAIFKNWTAYTSRIITSLMSEGRARHRRELPINIQNWFNKLAVPKMLGIGDWLITVVKVSSHLLFDTPPSFTHPTSFSYIHCLLPEFLPFRSNPCFVTISQATMATTRIKMYKAKQAITLLVIFIFMKKIRK